MFMGFMQVKSKLENTRFVQLSAYPDGSVWLKLGPLCWSLRIEEFFLAGLIIANRYIILIEQVNENKWESS